MNAAENRAAGALSRYGVKWLYALALAEGEGVGTAYEYYVKRQLLRAWLRPAAPPRHLLIAGLPQKYGVSLDWALLAHDWGVQPVVVDDRPEALARFSQALSAAQAAALLPGLTVDLRLTRDLTRLPELGEAAFDLTLSSEVLQRLDPAGRAAYWQRVSALGQRQAFFAPNGDNAAHTTLSGLAGLTLDEIRASVAGRPARTGYIDLPPFPPGVVRDAAQRDQASRGRLEALAMRGLAAYARIESLLPLRLRRRQAHIVYALIG